MATSAGAVYVDVKANTSPFERSMGGLGAVAGRIGKLIAGALSAAALVRFGKSCVDVASDLAEVQNVVDVTFSHMSGRMDEWAANAAQSFGLSETMAKRYAGTFGSMAEAFGFTERQAYDMSTALTGLAGDVASFYNISQDAAYTKLKSVFSGETESLKELGVVMTQSALDQYALANGFGRTTSAMTEQEKVSLRLAFVQHALTNASGDFARTSGSWANQVRLLALNFEQLRAAIGQSLIAALLPAVRVLNAVVLAATNAARAFNRFVEAVTGKSMGALMGGTEQVTVDLGNMGGTATDASGSLGDLGAAQTKAAKAAKAQDRAQRALNRTLAGFDKINKLSRESTPSGSGGTGAGGGGGVGGVSGGGLGAIADDADAAGAALSRMRLPDSLLASIERVRKAAGDLASTVSGGLAWAYENVLKPLGRFTINTVLPDSLNLMADALEHINDFLIDIGDPMGRFLAMCERFVEYAWTNALQPLLDFGTNQVLPRVLEGVGKAFDIIVTCMEKLQPVAQWVYENLLVPLAQTLGETLLAVLDGINTALGWIADTISQADFTEFVQWLDDHKGLVKRLAADIAGLLVAKKLIGPLTTLSGSAKALSKVIKGSKIASLVTKPLKALFGLVAAHPVVAVIAAVAAGVLLVWKNWDKIKKTKVGQAITAAGRTLKGLWKILKEKVAKAIKSVKDKIDAFKEAWNGIKDRAATLKAEAKEKVDGAIAALSTAWESVKDRTAELKATVADKAGDVKAWWEEKTAAWKDKVAELSLVVKTAVDTVKEWWGNLTAPWTNKTVDLNANDKTKGGVDSAKKTVGGLSGKTVDLSARNNTKNGYKAARNVIKKFAGKTVSLGAKNVVKDTVDAAQRKINSLYGKTVEIKTVTKVSGVKDLQLQLDSRNNKYTWQPHYFANGGYVGRNTPMLAVIGDNRREGEIVSPESKFQSMLDKAAGTSDVSELVPVLNAILRAVQSIDPNTYIDGREVTRTVVRTINQQTRATGVSPLVV